MFESVIGHDNEKNILKNIISTGNISHSYLFVGKNGIGKLTMAKEFAKILLDTNDLEKCLDYKLITREDGKKDISVETIRKELIDDINIAPAMSAKKVYIIDEAENLNSSSQNTLLKTLEEPPKNVHIILVASTSSTLLPTILSRVSQIKFNGLKKEQLDKYIQTNLETKLKDSILEYLDGSIGKAKYIIENNKIVDLENIDKLYSYIIKKDVINALKCGTNLGLSESDNLEYIEFLFSKNRIFSAIKFVEKASIRLKNNGNYDIVIDNMIMNIIDNI